MTDVAVEAPSTSLNAGTVDHPIEDSGPKHDALTKQLCTAQEQRALENRVKTIATQVDPCHARTVAFGRQVRTTPPLYVYAWDTSDPATASQDAAIDARIKSSLTQSELDCLIDQRSTIMSTRGKRGCSSTNSKVRSLAGAHQVVVMGRCIWWTSSSTHRARFRL